MICGGKDFWTVMHSFIEDDKHGLQEYLDLVQNELPPERMELFSCNEVRMLSSDICTRNHKIGLRSVIVLWIARISATEITVLLGNLLENAVEDV